jgi:hypothetical protein
MLSQTLRRARIASILLAGLAAWSGPYAAAGEGRPAAEPPLLPRYAQECSACHLAYPPRMLPAASWQRLMSGLSQHYGSDASLDPASVTELSAWLAANAGSGRRVGTAAVPEDRITRSTWFIREHDEVPAATWKLAAVKSPANCQACHPQGVFDERHVRIPR